MSVAAYLLPLMSLAVGLCALGVGLRLKVMDHPGGRKTHDEPTPLVGGIAVVAPILTFCALRVGAGADETLFLTLILAMAGAFLLGFWDDRFGLTSGVRLVAMALVALVCLVILPELVVEAFEFSFLAEPIPVYPFAFAFTTLVIVGMTNAVNMADGTNGLVCGLCLIWALLFLVYAPPELSVLLALLASCVLVTLIFNFRGRLFLGDSGSYALGMVISLLAIYSYNAPGRAPPADVVVLWFAVPVIDCLRLIVARACAGRSPLSPDNDHLHHRLQRLLPQRWGLVCYWMMVGVPGAIALSDASLAPVLVLAILGAYFAILLSTSDWMEARRGAALSVSAAESISPSRLGTSDQLAFAGQVKDQRKIILNSRTSKPSGAGRRLREKKTQSTAELSRGDRRA